MMMVEVVMEVLVMLVTMMMVIKAKVIMILQK